MPFGQKSGSYSNFPTLICLTNTFLEGVLNTLLIWVCVCVCVIEWVSEREKEREREKNIKIVTNFTIDVFGLKAVSNESWLMFFILIKKSLKLSSSSPKSEFK